MLADRRAVSDRTSLASPQQVAVVPSPALVSWSAMVLDLQSYAIVGFVSSVTSGPPCGLRFTIYRGKTTYVTGISSPDQNSPHAVQTGQISNPLHRGLWYDLEYAWFITGGDSQTRIAVGSSLVYVPAEGEGSWAGSG